nr:hypothetical protein BaRGS_015364 [Batillaria attramentaria]
MEARVECAAILSKDHVCSGCDTTPATSICLKCGDMMCIVCTKTHKKFSATKHHDVEDLATMTAERLAANRRLPCSVHDDEQSKLYCPTHGAAICHLCATSKHRACPEVTELEEKMQEARAVLAELAAILKVGESKLEGAISELDQYLVDMEKATRAALADIDHKCDRLQSSVEAFRKRMKQLAMGANCIDLSVTLPAELKAVARKTVVIDEKALARIERELSQLGQLSVTPAVKVASTPSAPGVTGDMAASQAVGQTTSWRFHTNHGKNIVLSNNRQTAERVRGKIDAIVISNLHPSSYNQDYLMAEEEHPEPLWFSGSFQLSTRNEILSK